MAFRMGMDSDLLNDVPADDIMEVLRTLPALPMVSDEEWSAIVNYFSRNAPDSLNLPMPPQAGNLSGFRIQAVKQTGSALPMNSMVRFLPGEPIIISGTRNAMLFRTDSTFHHRDSLYLGSPPSHLIAHNRDLYLTTMGIMDPNDQAMGRLLQLDFSTGQITTRIDSLRRPVYVEAADLNNDNQADLVISCFGNYRGHLLVAEKTVHGFKKHIVHHLPGTRKTLVRDFTGDGRPDILALITQGDEQLTLFINEGEFRFRPRILLRFPPVYGTSYFDLADFNGDGKWDIVCSQGDNADYSPILKPYHGIRVFLNQGDDTFSESWFYPMHGASQVEARDFDKDGDIDLAAISFFPDFQNHPENGFLYFENRDEMFFPNQTPLAATGRWISMDVGDFDSDGDDDIVLGALDFRGSVPDSLVQQWYDHKTSLLFLENQRF